MEPPRRCMRTKPLALRKHSASKILPPIEPLDMRICDPRRLRREIISTTGLGLRPGVSLALDSLFLLGGVSPEALLSDTLGLRQI